MAVEHNFTHPRNLYEKLERDSTLLEAEVSGDNFFNFISTACHLQAWIKNEAGMKSDAVVKRLIKKIHETPGIRKCEDILAAKKQFRIFTDLINDELIVEISDERFNIHEFKNSIMEVYQSYFHVKGH
ncbi:MAG: hypothetical protein KKA84_00805 [Bacteroidetes bacterium]|nr:hypothetical protein [Bacteroidota bacterium]